MTIAVASGAVAAENSSAGDVKGLIRVTKRLTKKRVPPAAVYHRGAAVPPASDGDVSFTQAELERTVIYLESDDKLPSAAITATIDQKNRTFLPETLIIPVGSTVSFPNLDPIFHNVFSLSRTRTFDLGNFPMNETRTVRFDKTGIVPVYRHLHPDMRANIVVAPNRWIAQPDSNGQYALRDIPAGDHTIVVWHRTAGFFRAPIHIQSGEAVGVDFTIPVDPSDRSHADARSRTGQTRTAGIAETESRLRRAHAGTP